MNDDKVIHAFPRAELPENPLEVDRRHSNWCQHDNVRLDDHLRIITCAKCAAVLDAFDFVRHNAAVIQRAWDNHRIVSRNVADLNERVDGLKREEKRLRAQIKRLQDKIGPVVSVRVTPKE